MGISFDGDIITGLCFIHLFFWYSRQIIIRKLSTHHAICMASKMLLLD